MNRDESDNRSFSRAAVRLPRVFGAAGCPVLLFLALLTCRVAAGTERETSPVQSLYEQSWSRASYVAPVPAELERSARLFERILSGDTGAETAQFAQEAGYVLTLVTEGRDTVAVLRECETRREGRGFFLFRSDAGAKDLLMAPHRQSDRLTGDLVLKLFLSGGYRCAAWNTIPRYSGPSRDDSQDLARLEDTWFNALAAAFAKRFDQQHVIQLHGFSVEKRRNPAGGASDCIVSNGTELACGGLKRLAACLNREAHILARVYPLEVRELGATTNSTGKVLRSMDFSGFVHVELNYETRVRLWDKPDDLAAFSRCLQSF